MKITIVENVVMPTGDYIAQVVEIQPDEGNFGPQLRWRFEIIHPEEYQEKSILGWTSTSPSLSGRFVKWASACLARQIAPGEQLATEDLVGLKVVLTVIVREGDDGTEYNKIDSVKAYKKGKLGPIPPTAPAAEDEDVFGDE